MTDAIGVPDTLEREYDTLVARAGLRIPPERRAVMINCYAQVRAWSEIIRSTRRAAADEPANVYSLRTITAVGEDGQ